MIQPTLHSWSFKNRTVQVDTRVREQDKKWRNGAARVVYSQGLLKCSHVNFLLKNYVPLFIVQLLSIGERQFVMQIVYRLFKLIPKYLHRGTYA